MKRPVLKHLRIPKYDSDLSTAVKCIEGLTLSLVKTKYNDGNWEAISLRGYSKDPNNILKPGVLKSEETASELQDTTLRFVPEMQPINEILSKIPAEFQRVRFMRLKAGTKIEKHTDKVDKTIGFEDGEIIRIHVPIKTDPKVVFSLYEGKERKDFYLEVGNYYYADVTKPHEVYNAWDDDRIHLVADCYSNQTMRDLILE
jgi:hypothetical protein|tara:strand:+ start:1183 stop:1785 length:603 start_codon:yes stop_codon:yes gene_type:complete